MSSTRTWAANLTLTPNPNQAPPGKRNHLPKLKRNLQLKPRHHHQHLTRMKVPARKLIPLPLMTWTTTPRAKVGVRPNTTLPLPTSIVPAISGCVVTLATCACLMLATSPSKIDFSTFARWPKLIEELDVKGDNITVLSKDDGDVVWNNWVDPHLQNNSKAPGTIVSYLTSLEKFYSYLTSRKYDPKKMPPLHQNHKDVFLSMKTSLKGWRPTVDLRTQDRQVRRYLHECDDMLTAAEVEKLKTSKPYNDGLKAFSNAEAGKLLSVQEFLEARDLLLVKLTIATGTRPAPLENAILEDYFRAKVHDEKKIMLVARHKRSADGPAILGFDSELQKLMATYLEHIRPNFANPEVTNIFVKKDGNAFSPGTIGKRVSAFWDKSGVSMKRVAATDLRKFISTSTHLHAPEEAEKVAKVMSHSKETAQRSYVRADLTKVGSQAMDVIRQVTLTKSPENDAPPEANKEEMGEESESDSE